MCGLNVGIYCFYYFIVCLFILEFMLKDSFEICCYYKSLCTNSGLLQKHLVAYMNALTDDSDRELQAVRVRCFMHFYFTLEMTAVGQHEVNKKKPSQILNCIFFCCFGPRSHHVNTLRLAVSLLSPMSQRNAARVSQLLTIGVTG